MLDIHSCIRYDKNTKRYRNNKNSTNVNTTNLPQQCIDDTRSQCENLAALQITLNETNLGVALENILIECS